MVDGGRGISLNDNFAFGISLRCIEHSIETHPYEADVLLFQKDIGNGLALHKMKRFTRFTSLL